MHRVLVVDDFRDTAEILCSALTLVGHACWPAHTGQQAITLARQYEPTLVLLDLGLPDITGFEVARLLRLARPTLIITALTGLTKIGERERALAAGFDHFVLKPVAFSALQQIVESISAPLTN